MLGGLQKGGFQKGGFGRWSPILKFPFATLAEENDDFWYSLSVATPAEPRGEKTFLLCKCWAVKPFYKSAGEKSLGGVRGAYSFSDTFRIVYRILFFAFFKQFFVSI